MLAFPATRHAGGTTNSLLAEKRGMPREDWVLIVIALSPTGALQPLQLQCCIYLLGKKVSLRQLKSVDFYDYRKHDYGTFALPVHMDAERLVGTGLCWLRHDLWTREYVITEDGRRAAQRAMAELSSDVIAYARQLVQWITSFPVGDLMHVSLDDYGELRREKP
jgi:hypothetical protein